MTVVCHGRYKAKIFEVVKTESEVNDLYHIMPLGLEKALCPVPSGKIYVTGRRTKKEKELILTVYHSKGIITFFNGKEHQV
jgi:hypothetical protein